MIAESGKISESFVSVYFWRLPALGHMWIPVDLRHKRTGTHKHTDGYRSTILPFW